MVLHKIDKRREDKDDTKGGYSDETHVFGFNSAQLGKDGFNRCRTQTKICLLS